MLARQCVVLQRQIASAKDRVPEGIVWAKFERFLVVANGRIDISKRRLKPTRADNRLVIRWIDFECAFVQV